ncbi:MAG: heme o synthase [Gemmataceae bacterium]|nr:heme o synthase [Gemmataceae bacterium]
MTTSAPLAPRSRLADFVGMTKPRIAVLVLFVTAAGMVLANPGGIDLLQMFHTLVGTFLVAGSANVLNQVIERHSDKLMRRTENRPLPSGRLSTLEVSLFGIGLGFGGLAYMALTLEHPLAVGVAAFTLVSYVLIYTPSKRYTTLNTLIGAVPGAMPPIIGWTAAGGSLNAAAGLVFLILFLWQVPHFLAIAWMYREDYSRAGLRMLPSIDPDGLLTARQMVGWCVTLVAISLYPAIALRGNWAASFTGPLYGIGALLVGTAFLAATIAFWKRKTHARAKLVMKVSLLYLPVLMLLMLAETWMKSAAAAVVP